MSKSFRRGRREREARKRHRRGRYATATSDWLKLGSKKSWVWMKKSLAN